MITSAKVQNRTGDFTICYKGDREKVIKLLQTFRYEEVDIPENYAQNSGRELNQEYWDKLVETVIYHYGNKLFLPYSVRACITAVKSVKYLWMGVRTLAKGKIEVPGIGCDRNRSIYVPRRYRNCRIRHVPAWNRRNPGRVDTQEIRW